MDFTLFPFTKLFWIGILAFWQWAPFNSFPMAGWQAGGLLAKLNFLQPRLGNPTICKAFFPQASFYGFQSFAEPTMCVALYWGFLGCIVWVWRWWSFHRYLHFPFNTLKYRPSPANIKWCLSGTSMLSWKKCCIWTRLWFLFGGSRNWKRSITLRE